MQQQEQCRMYENWPVGVVIHHMVQVVVHNFVSLQMCVSRHKSATTGSIITPAIILTFSASGWFLSMIFLMWAHDWSGVWSGLCQVQGGVYLEAYPDKLISKVPAVSQNLITPTNYLNPHFCWKLSPSFLLHTCRYVGIGMRITKYSQDLSSCWASLKSKALALDHIQRGDVWQWSISLVPQTCRLLQTCLLSSLFILILSSSFSNWGDHCHLHAHFLVPSSSVLLYAWVIFLILGGIAIDVLCWGQVNGINIVWINMGGLLPHLTKLIGRPSGKWGSEAPQCRWCGPAYSSMDGCLLCTCMGTRQVTHNVREVHAHMKHLRLNILISAPPYFW